MLKIMITTFVLLGVVGCGVEGVHSANPTTVIRVDPYNRSVYVSNNKDVDLSLDELSYDKESNNLVVKNLQIVDNASVVRSSNVAQLEAISIQTQMITQAIIQGIREAVPILGGYATNPIWGQGQAGAVPNGSGGWIYVGPEMKAVVEPTTQPGG